MPRKSDAHKWVYAELPPVAGDEHPRPAQRCARCGLVRRAGINTSSHVTWLYHNDARWLKLVSADAEPPCEPRAEADAQQPR